uniref:Uncharacterized protein n=1 Tax=Sinocyclocheilus grahami TaxID=75366 RepID=A0A672PX96_SINGR
MDYPAFQILLLEQGERSLEDHTNDFLSLAQLTHYPDNCLCTFYRVGLNATTRAQLSGDGPRESFATFIEWVLVSCKSHLTVDIADNTSPTQDPEPSPPSPRGTEHQPEPTDDGEPAILEPEQSPTAEKRIASDVEPNMSDQVREPETVPTTREHAVDGVSAERSSAPCIMAEGERTMEGLQGQNEEERPQNPQSSPGRAPDPQSSPGRAPDPHPGRAPDPQSSPGRAPDVSFSPGRAPDPQSSPGRAPDPQSSPGRAPDPQSSPGRAPDPQSSPGRAPDPQSSPGRAPDPQSSPGRAPDPQSSPGRAPDPQSSPGRAPDPQSSPGRAPDPQSSPGRAPDPQSSPGRAPDPQSSPGRAPDPQSSPGRAPDPQSSPGRAPDPQSSPGRAPDPQSSPGRPSAPPWPPGSSTSPWLVGSPSPARAPPPPAPPPLVGPLESVDIPPPAPPSSCWKYVLRRNLHQSGLPASPLASPVTISHPLLCPPPSPPLPLPLFLRCEDVPSGRGE